MGYYQGDFYQGDPGFFSFLGGLAKKAVGFIPGVGPIASAMIPSGRSAAVKATATAIVRRGAGAVMRHPVLSAAGAAGAVGLGGAAIGRRGRAGAMGRVPGMRRRRRMNVCNPKALRKAIRRSQGFAKLAMRTIHLVHPKKKVRFGGFKHRRRKAA